MLNPSITYFYKSSIIWLCILIVVHYSTNTIILSRIQIKEVQYYHNIFRYVVTIGNIQKQPMASDMRIMRWKPSMVESLNTLTSECIRNSHDNLCPPLNVYRIKRGRFDVSKIVQKWFDVNQYYDYSTDTCTTMSCDSYKRIVDSNYKYLACVVKKINGIRYFVCQYEQSGPHIRPYKVGRPCYSCDYGAEICFKEAFCIPKDECNSNSCDDIMTGPSDLMMQSDEQQFCVNTVVDCEIAFYKHMCPKICAPSSTLTTLKSTTTTKMLESDDDKVCVMITIDCSIEFFKILCPKTCENVLCRDPNLDCRNVFYAKCKKCIVMNQKMADSKITTTTVTSSIEHALGLIDPKCQDISYDTYCLDRGEMCFHSSYESWMKKFCCQTCRILNICFDYLEFKTPGKCADISASGMCSTLWSQAYCRKTCNKC